MTAGNDQSSYDSLAKKLESYSQGGAPIYFTRSNATIVTSTDSLFRILTNHQAILEKRTYWLALLGIGLTILVTLLTTRQFNEFLGLTHEIWRAIFIVSLGICVLWTVKAGIGLRNHLGTLWRGDSIDFLIEKIENDSEAWRHSSGNGGKKDLTFGQYFWWNLLSSMSDSNDAEDQKQE